MTCGLLMAVGCSRAEWRSVPGQSGLRIFHKDSTFALTSAVLLHGDGGIVVTDSEAVERVDNQGNTTTLLAGRNLGATDIVLSLDGALCACGSGRGKLWVWETTGWKIVAQREFAGAVQCIGFTSDSKRIVLQLRAPNSTPAGRKNLGKASVSERVNLRTLKEIVLADIRTLELFATPVLDRERPIISIGYYAPKNLLAVYYARGGDRGEVVLVDVAANPARILREIPMETTFHMAIAGGTVLVASTRHGGADLIALDTGRPIAQSARVPTTAVAAGESSKLYAIGEGVAVPGPGKLVIRSCQTGKACAESNYHRPLVPLCFDTSRGILIATASGEDLLRWDLPKDLRSE
jgi:hypothetical protein